MALVAPTRPLAFSMLAGYSAALLALIPCLAPALQGLLLLPGLLLLYAGPGQPALYNQCAVVEDQGAAGVVKGIWKKVEDVVTTTASSEGTGLWPRLPCCVIHRAQGGAIELGSPLA